MIKEQNQAIPKQASGLPPSGLSPSGLSPSGLSPNGLPPNGLPPNGLPPNELLSKRVQTNTIELEDKELMARFKNADTQNYAFNLIVRKYQERIYHHVRKMVIDHDDADDLTQEVFIKAWKGLINFREDSQLFTWLYRIASNECLTFLDKKKRRFFLPIHDLKRELTSKLNSMASAKSMHISGDEIELKLQKAILQLPNKQRLVFNMKYFDEMTYEQMSEVLGTSVGALKASYHHAVKKIEESLNQE